MFKCIEALCRYFQAEPSSSVVRTVSTAVAFSSSNTSYGPNTVRRVLASNTSSVKASAFDSDFWTKKFKPEPVWENGVAGLFDDDANVRRHHNGYNNYNS